MCVFSAHAVSVCVTTYVLEAAAHTGFDVGAAERGHLPQLSGDLDGIVEQQAKLPLVTRVPG